jgi:hypothetical protein
LDDRELGLALELSLMSNGGHVAAEDDEGAQGRSETSGTKKRKRNDDGEIDDDNISKALRISREGEFDSALLLHPC